MSDTQPGKEPLLSDDQMDQLLSAFYPGEEPEALAQLPSAWSELQDRQGGHQPLTIPARPVPGASRGIFVAVATLAMCVVVMLVWSGSRSNDATATDSQAQTPEQQLENTMNVSGDGQPGGGVIGDDNTTLEEIDNIDLTSEPMPTDVPHGETEDVQQQQNQ